MYQPTQYGQTWVRKDGVRWNNWIGRQTYKYRLARKARG